MSENPVVVLSKSLPWPKIGEYYHTRGSPVRVIRVIPQENKIKVLYLSSGVDCNFTKSEFHEWFKYFDTPQEILDLKVGDCYSHIKIVKVDEIHDDGTITVEDVVSKKKQVRDSWHFTEEFQKYKD